MLVKEEPDVAAPVDATDSTPHAAADLIPTDKSNSGLIASILNQIWQDWTNSLCPVFGLIFSDQTHTPRPAFLGSPDKVESLVCTPPPRDRGWDVKP